MDLKLSQTKFTPAFLTILWPPIRDKVTVILHLEFELKPNILCFFFVSMLLLVIPQGYNRFQNRGLMLKIVTAQDCCLQCSYTPHVTARSIP